MSKAKDKAKEYAEKFILTVDHQSDVKEAYIDGYNQAEIDLEIAKEEVIEKACDAYCKVCGHYAHTTPTHICRQACDYYKDFREHMKRK